jgi:hypothetical protein
VVVVADRRSVPDVDRSSPSSLPLAFKLAAVFDDRIESLFFPDDSSVPQT